MALSTSSAPRQLSDGNSAGTVLGKSASDLISFFNATPTSQLAGAAQTAMARGVGGGMVGTNATSQSPGGVTPQSTNEVAVGLGVTTNASTGGFLLVSTDFVFVNKPTQQAGIGLGNVRVSSTSQVAVTFSNFTAATVTATAGEKWGVVALRGLPFITQTITPAVVSAATTNEQTFTVTGIRVGDVVAVMPAAHTTNVNIAGVRVAGPNQVAITYSNASPTTATTPAAGQYTFWSTGGVDSVANVVRVNKNIGASFGPSSSTVTANGFTMTGLATADAVMGAQKPTAQTGMSVGNAFVSGANVLGVNFVNITATVTPTTYECWDVSIYRPAPAAPIVNYSQALTPSAVPPNSTSSQAFTVTGLVNSSLVFVNKPSWQPGLGLGGARVSGTNQLEITFINATAATITPTAGETYAIANFQQPVPDVGDTWLFQVTPQQVQNAVLSNAIRAALVAEGLIAGA